MEARNDGRGQFDHSRIDYQPEQTECEQNQGEGDDLKKNSQRGIDEANHEGRNQSRQWSVDMKSRHQSGNDPERQRAQRPVQEMFHGTLRNGDYRRSTSAVQPMYM